MFKGYGAKVGLGNMRVKAENRMVTTFLTSHDTYFTLGYGKPKTTFKGEPREGKAVEPLYRIKESVDLSKNFNTVRTAFYLAMSDILEAKKDSLINKERLE